MNGGRWLSVLSVAALLVAALTVVREFACAAEASSGPLGDLAALPLMVLLGWGALTHAWINRKAYWTVKGEGRLPDWLDSPAAQQRFEVYGTMPDAISTFALVEGDHAFDAYHCLNPYGNDGKPEFALELLKVAEEADDDEARIAACGWCAHQLADSTAHYGGYCESLPTLKSSFTGDTRRDIVGRRVLRDIDHGLTEILGDVLAASVPPDSQPDDQPDLLDWMGFPCEPKHIEKASRRTSGFPLLKKGDWPTLCARYSEVLVAMRALARALRNAKTAVGSAADLIRGHYNEAPGKVNQRGMDDWCQHAVNLIAVFLRDRQSCPWATEKPRDPLPPGEGGLPSRTRAGVPALGGILPYRIADVTLKSAVGPLIRATLPALGGLPDVWEDNIMLWLLGWVDDLDDRSLMMRVTASAVRALRRRETFAQLRRRIVADLPPLADANSGHPTPGQEIPADESLELRLELVDVAGDGGGPTDLAIESITVNGHAVEGASPPKPAWAKDDKGVGFWTLTIPVGRALAPGAYEVQVGGSGPQGKPFEFEWEFSVVDKRKPGT